MCVREDVFDRSAEEFLCLLVCRISVSDEIHTLFVHVADLSRHIDDDDTVYFIDVKVLTVFEVKAADIFMHLYTLPSCMYFMLSADMNDM